MLNGVTVIDCQPQDSTIIILQSILSPVRVPFFRDIYFFSMLCCSIATLNYIGQLIKISEQNFELRKDEVGSNNTVLFLVELQRDRESQCSHSVCQS